MRNTWTQIKLDFNYKRNTESVLYKDSAHKSIALNCFYQKKWANIILSLHCVFFYIFR